MTAREAQTRCLKADDHPLKQQRIIAQQVNVLAAQVPGRTPFSPSRALLVGLCVVLAGCGARNANVAPTIEFIKVPHAGEGGPDKVETIEGRVSGARSGEQIVLYARWGPWWVQPLIEEPFTKIEPDTTWKSSTHFGTEYAALLVEPGYRPPATMDTLPRVGASVMAVAVTAGRPVFWRTSWFLLGAAVAFALAVLMIFRTRMNQLTRQHSLRLEERLAERTRIAQELHDTLLQDFLSVSMQLNVANDRLPVDSPAKPLVTRSLEMMGRVIEAGRNTVQGLRFPTWGSRDLEKAFSRIPEELRVAKRRGLRVIVGGVARPLRPTIGDEVYLIGREALANAFRHSGASEIEVELEYAPDQMKLVVRDNGCGIARDLAKASRTEHLGLSGMRERADRIGAKLRVFSRADAGTEIELSVASQIAYLPLESDRSRRWLSTLAPRTTEANDAGVESEQVR